MNKWQVLIGLAVVLAVLVGGIGYLLLRSDSEADKRPLQITPSATTQILILPSVMPSPTPTASPTSSPFPTTTATLATRIAAVSIIMPDVTLPPSATPLPDNLTVLSEAPTPLEPLLDATLLPFPYSDFSAWVSFESDHPAIRYTAGNWTPLPSERASQGQYHYSEDTNATVSLTFHGSAVRVRYVGFTNGGIWEVMVDGVVLDRIDSYAPSGLFTGTAVYTLAPGEHTLTLRNTDTANAASTGYMLALDAVQVYQPDALTLIVPGGVLPSPSPTATLIPAQAIELLAAPPSPAPTATAIPVQIVTASLVIGYDENANGTLDVSEGVRGISVRLVEGGTNHVLGQAFTDAQGFVSLQAQTNSPVLLVVSYFSQSWTLQQRNQGQAFTLLLSPGNQPGLIP